MLNFASRVYTVNEQDVESCSFFTEQLIQYINLCPCIDCKKPRERHSYHDNAVTVLSVIQNLFQSNRNVDAIKLIAYIAYELPAPNECIVDGNYQISKTSKRRDNTSDIIKNAKRYLGAVCHTEVMYYVLQKSVLKSNNGFMIVSGKCPCPDCDIFIRHDSVRAIFDNVTIIGYSYGWMSQDGVNEKKNYLLRCTQIADPVKINDKGEHCKINNNHIKHIGNTPITDVDIQCNMRVFVVGPVYKNPEISENDCANPNDSAGNCTIKEKSGTKQYDYQNFNICSDTIK